MKVAMVTGSRADWNGLGMVGKCLRDEYKVTVEVIAIGQMAEVSSHLEQVFWDGFNPHVLHTDYKEDMVCGAGKATLLVGPLLAAIRPDVVLVLGDRFEILGAATAAALQFIPVAHIGGGDITEGAIDNKIRYAITALADLHFVTHLDSYRRVGRSQRTSTGEFKSDTVLCTGAPALDRIRLCQDIVAKDSFFEWVGLTQSKYNILVACHSTTLDPDSATCASEMVDALEGIQDASFIVLGTNSDSGSHEVAKILTSFVMQFGDNRAELIQNLAPPLFYAALTHCDCMVGNSSAGLVETATFGIPVVNIGNRQKGRPSPMNVLNCSDDWADIKKTIMLALTNGRLPCKSPYGDGHSAPLIAKALTGQFLDRMF